MTAVQLEDVHLRYGNAVALDGVSLEVASGELLPVLGPSGCGKTSVLRVLAGLTFPDSGRVRIGDDLVNDPLPRVPAHRRGIGMVFQQLALWPHLTVHGNLEFGLKARGVPRTERRPQINEILSMVGLAGFGGRLPSELSGGERQRVALARALVGRPRVLLMDEPLSSVDAMLKDELLGQVRRVNRELGLTSLYVTHDKGEALALGRRVAVMERGRLVQVDTPESLSRRPANRFVATLMGALNLFYALRGENGQLLPLDDASVKDAPPPGAVLAAARPEGLLLLEDGPLHGTVEASVFQGAGWLVVIRAGALDLKVWSNQSLDPGTEVAMALKDEPMILEEG